MRRNFTIAQRYRARAALALPFALAFFLATDAFVSTAEAQSNYDLCRSLRAELAAASRVNTGGNSKKYRQYENAIRKQKLQIGKTNRAARRNGCSKASQRRSNQCRRIASSLKKMQANLTSLKRTRDKLSPNLGGNSNKRHSIIRRLENNGCYADQDTRTASNQPTQKSRRRTLLEQVFGLKTYSDSGHGQYGEDIEGDASIFSRFGTYRTLCVRKSDGYYFPISFSTVPQRFDYDEELCRNMCPSSDVALYIHRMPSQDSEDMVAYRSEIPYAQEPFAFAYRKTHNPENRCRFSIAGLDQGVDAPPTGEVEEETEDRLRVGIPNFRKDPTEIPDAYDNEVGNLTLLQAEAYLLDSNNPAKDIADRDISETKKVRIVGPAFFPVQ